MTTPTITLDADTAVPLLDRATRAIRGALGEPDTTTRYPVPPVIPDFIEAPDLKRIMADLIDKYESRFGHLREQTIAVLWKREGGNAGGVAQLAKTKKLLGTERYFVGKDYVIWFAADHAKGFELTRHQVEALVYSQLMRTGITEKGSPCLVPIEFSGFVSEVAIYGMWSAELQRAGDAFQSSMFDPEDGDDDEDEE